MPINSPYQFRDLEAFYPTLSTVIEKAIPWKMSLFSEDKI